MSSLSLPSSLEEYRLTIISVGYDGSYEDNHGIRQRIPREVLRVVRMMKEGQKVLVIKEREDNSSDEDKENREEETRIWLVHFSVTRLLLTR
jgi:hypothetical protein